jgi:DNA-binding CsgD family transcriptional regulator
MSMQEKDFIGKNDAILPWGDFTDVLKCHDHAAITQKTISLIEPLPLSKNTVVPINVIKSAIIDKSGETIGILVQSNFGALGDNWTTFLSILSQKDKKILDTLFSYQIKGYDSQFKFTKREMECMFLLIRGKTAKEIALFLNLSFRTIETYIENIKMKMCVDSRAAIIEKAIEINFVSIIPQNILLDFLYRDFQKWKGFLP